MARPLRNTSLATAVTSLLLIGCAPQPVNQEFTARAVEGYIEDADKLVVVDCLLPGQLRKLGSQMTYLSARRPVRTTAADCEVRGGEYVAYDRANYATALKIWLPKAQEGDMTAQLYVGQIYEKGLGQPADYRAAADWYRKAAAQGNAQAQLNLGHLYEKGLGVPKNRGAAMEWYRKAAGLETAGLQFASALEAAPAASAAQQQELDTLRETLKQRQLEIERLRAQLGSTQDRLLEQQASLRQAQDELETLRAQLSRERSAPAAADDDRLKQLEQTLRRKEAQLKSRQEQVSGLAAALKRERQALQRQRETARRADAAPIPAAPARSEPPKPADPLTLARAELLDTENAYQAKLDYYQQQAAELTSWLTDPSRSVTDEETREKIDQRKRALQKQAEEITAYREKVEQQTRQIKSLEQEGAEHLAAADPRIDIIEPPLTLTRGVPVIQVKAGTREIVGKIEATAGLSSLIVNDRPQTVDASGLFRFPVTLQGTSMPVKIAATDKRNRTNALVINLIGETAEPGETPIAAADLGARDHYSGVDFGKFYALIIGNNQYRAYPSLRTPISDARSLDVILRERYGFTTKLLLNADRYAIMTALNEIHKKLTDKDNVLIYYAGHGEIDPSTQTAYWLPVDAEVGNAANWISSQSVTEFLSIMPARHILVVADSCYSGALTGSAIAKLPPDIDESKRAKWLKVMVTRKARTVLTSGGVKPVLDEGGGEHSVFANAFLNVLRSNQRVLEDFALFGAISSRVRASASRAGFEQTPQYAPLQHAGHEGSPFFFVPERV